MKSKLIYISLILFLFASSAKALEMPVSVLQMPSSGNVMAEMSGVSAEAYLVVDAQSGQILISKNADEQWTPASLTKLITALVVLDTNPNLNQSVTMSKADQVAGYCTSGGACIKTASGVKFSLDGLFHAALIPSANNAANALARSTGLSTADFAQKMNDKVASLGATSSHFYEPTGMNPQNKITASDYAKIAVAAFSNPYIRKTAGLSNYTLKSVNNSKYNQTIKNTNALLTDPDISVLAAKTGYLNESGYNFSSLVQSFGGQQFIVVVLGERHLSNAFKETKQLTALGLATKILALGQTSGAVLGASTVLGTNN